ncbi:MAG: aminopeptidase P N-terminal domain-containing protein [Bacteroidota bacterium]
MHRYPKLPTQLFINNRKKLVQHLPPNALVVLNANDILPTNADGTMPFRQNSDLFYLSGLEQPETILVLYPDAPENMWREMLFIKETSEETRIWEGQPYTPAEARAIAGIDLIHALGAFEGIFRKIMQQATYVYLNTNEHPRASQLIPSRDMRFVQWCQQVYPLHEYRRLAPIMRDLRVVKSETEVDLMRKACMITEQGFKRILPLIKPGIMEYDVEAELMAEFLRHGSAGFAYEPIVASGANACVLHYTANNCPCQDGDVLLIDSGALYAHYCADITRVVPVNGRFTQRQKKVYKAVLNVMQQARQLLTPGNDFTSYHQAVGTTMEQALVQLGLLSLHDIRKQDPDNPAYKKYFMHGTSHHIGLDTHDVGDAYRKFEVGMALTIEPGIYIPAEKLGIRLENNGIIQEDGFEELNPKLPIEAEAIEAWMHEEQ